MFLNTFHGDKTFEKMTEYKLEKLDLTTFQLELLFRGLNFGSRRYQHPYFVYASVCAYSLTRIFVCAFATH